MKLSIEELLHIAKLAKLSLTKEEQEKFCNQISDILTFVSQLKEVNVAESALTGNITGEINNWRNDTHIPSSAETRKALLDAAPERDGDLIKVPGVFDAN